MPLIVSCTATSTSLSHKHTHNVFKLEDIYIFKMAYLSVRNIIVPLSLCQTANRKFIANQVILAGTLTGVQGDIRCKVLAALSHSKITRTGTGLIEGCKRKKCVLVICSLK